MARAKRRGSDAVFRALADETRRDLLDALRAGPQTTRALVERHPQMSRFGVMDHLRVLEGAGLVIAERNGRDRLNHLNPVPIQRIHDRWTGRFAREVASELIALDAAASGKGRSRQEENTMVTQAPPLMAETLEAEVHIEADAPTVWRALTREIGDWWPHRFRDDVGTVELEPVVGGRFVERFDADGAGALYAIVTYIDPEERVLKISGSMGLKGAAMYVKTYRLEPGGEGTTVRTSASMLGPFGQETVHSYREGGVELLRALKAHVEAPRTEA
jgi:DNA-binding transcriptional ArsR family regulator/uncharacterized protein YndB with AHSA1/START domain